MSDRQEIIYVANMRLPSEKAHSVQVMEMCAALGAAGSRTILLVPDRKTDITADPFAYYGVPRVFNIIRLSTFDAFRLPLPRKLAYYLHAWSFGRSVSRFAKTHPGAAILSRDLYAAYRLAKSGRSVAFEVHDLPSDRAAKMLRAIPRIIATNEWKRGELVRRFGTDASRIRVAPNAVDVKKFSALGDAGTLRRELGWPEDKKIVLYAGHLFAWKGVETLARASALLGPDAGVVVAGGTAEDSARFRDFLNREKLSVTLLPHRPHAEMPGVLASASVLVLPTSAKYSIGRVETSPIKAFEYLAAGKPIVASDVPSSREVLDEKTAVFFKPDDPADCARAIREALAIEAEVMKAAQADMVQSRTWQARAKGIIEFLAA